MNGVADIFLNLTLPHRRRKRFLVSVEGGRDGEEV